MAAIVLGESGLFPASRAMGSPGARKTMPNTSRIVPRSTGTTSNSRLIRYLRDMSGLARLG